MDKFQTAGAVVAIIILFFQLFKEIPVVPRFILKCIRLPQRWWRMFRQRYRDWCYWRHFGGRHEIVSIGNLQVERKAFGGQSNIYILTLPLTLKFENRDDLEQMLAECRDMQFGIDSRAVKGRSKKTYLLNPVLGDTTLLLPSATPNGKPVEKQYIMQWSNEMQPRLGKTAVCRMMKPGIIRVGGVTRPIKIKSFPVEVDWSMVEESTSHS